MRVRAAENHGTSEETAQCLHKHIESRFSFKLSCVREFSEELAAAKMSLQMVEQAKTEGVQSTKNEEVGPRKKSEVEFLKKMCDKLNHIEQHMMRSMSENHTHECMIQPGSVSEESSLQLMLSR